MSDLNQEELKRNVSDKDTWTRFVYMAVLFVAFYLTAGIALAVALFQFLSKLFTGKVMESISEFGGNLGVYMSQTISYLTYASDERPFPFASFPKQVLVTVVKPDQDKAA